MTRISADNELKLNYFQFIGISIKDHKTIFAVTPCNCRANDNLGYGFKLGFPEKIIFKIIP